MATGLAAELAQAHPDASIEKLPGGKGDFIVTVDGHKLWDKRRMSDPRFPEHGEIAELIAARR